MSEGSVQTVVVGGMPGWQIALIAVAAAVVAAAVAVLLDRARVTRTRHVTSPPIQRPAAWRQPGHAAGRTKAIAFAEQVWDSYTPWKSASSCQRPGLPVEP